MAVERPAGAAAGLADPLVADPLVADPLTPDGDALAAILAAVERCVEVPGGGTSPPRAGRPGWTTSASYPWRFAGRWWSGPAPLRRERPGT